MKKSILVIGGIILIGISGLVYLAYRYNYIPHIKYDSAHFGIDTYISDVDYDGDSIDDQTDILNGARKYVATDPKYKSKYYASGFPDDEYGVCTDVVAFALLEAGYNLMELVNEDIKTHRDDYDIDVIDKNIDFRRVNNLQKYFSNNAISLSLDINDIAEWQGGDIVVFDGHIGIVSDKRNYKGIPFVIHLANHYQASYEEDILGTYGNIIGHFRIS